MNIDKPQPYPSQPTPEDSETSEAVEILDSQRLHLGQIFELRHEVIRLASGLEQRLDVIVHPGAVAIAARLESGELLVVRQYRHATGESLLEIPAGRLNPGEDPLTAAKRELEEETGFRAAKWSAARVFYPAPGFASERMHLFIASQLQAVPGGGLAQDEDEELSVERARPDDLLAQSRDAKTLVAAALALRDSSANHPR